MLTMAKKITIETCDRMIDLYTECLAALAEGKTFQVGDRILSFENAEIANRTLNMWINRKNLLVRNSRRIKRFRGVSGHATFAHEKYRDYPYE